MMMDRSDEDLVGLAEIRAAARRIASFARVTPLLDASSHFGRPLWLKCEHLQPGGAFKIRGAFNMVAQLTPDERRRGVITFSSGNHGQAMALAARTLDAPAVVVMPTTAPQIKVDAVRAHGAEVIFAGTTSTERRARAEAEAAARGLTIVPPFDHPWIIAGAGTAGLEILEQRPDVSAVLVPVGGGGFAAGVAAAIRLSRPDVTVIGVEPSGAAAMQASLAAGSAVTLARSESIADGLMTVRPGDLTLAHAQRFVARIVTVEEHEIAAAVVFLTDRLGIRAEPSGAVTVAAALAGAGGPGPTVAIVSGGNVSPERIQELRRL